MIGDGDCAGEVTLGLLLGIAIGVAVVVWAICGVLWEAAGESVIDPNWIAPFDPPTGPPFGIVTELLRP